MKAVKRDIKALERLIEQVEYHIQRKQFECAKKAIIEAQQVRIRIANRLSIENYIQTKYNRTMH